MKLTKRQIEHREYLLTKEWAEIRIVKLTACNFKCERCSSKRNLQVHHLTYKNWKKEEPNDLEVLCSGCHRKEHRIKKKSFRKRKKRKSCNKSLLETKTYSKPMRGSIVRDRILNLKNLQG